MLKSILKGIYEAIPFKQALFSGLKAVYTPSKGVYQHLHFTGTIPVNFEGKSFRLHHHGEWMENEIFWEGMGGSWEATSFKLWAKLAPRAAVAIDIGAYEGIYAVMARVYNPTSQVFAFEPAAQMKLIAEKNMRLNNVQVDYLTLGLGNENGEIPAGVLPVRSLKPEPVKIIRLEDFILERNLQSVDLMKVDVDGSEDQVLLGMGPFLSQYMPDMLIEVLSSEAATKLEKVLGGLNYRRFHLLETSGKIIPIDALHAQDKSLDEVNYNFLVCKPATASFLGLA